LQTFEETERRHWECMENEWEREKQKILNSLRGLGQDTIDFQPESEVCIYFLFNLLLKRKFKQLLSTTKEL
jgi:hypothetical protein